jgi:hypothetical protein
MGQSENVNNNQQVHKFGTQQIDLRNKPKGIYFIEIQGDHGKVVKKVVLQ